MGLAVSIVGLSGLFTKHKRGAQNTKPRRQKISRSLQKPERSSMAVLGLSTSTLPSFYLRSTTIHRSNPSTIPRSFLAHPPSFPTFTLSNPHSQIAVVSSDSKATSFDLSAPDLDNSGGGGSIKGNGDDFGGGGGGGEGGGGDDSNKGEEGSNGDKRKMALSISQKLTLGYAILVGGIYISEMPTFYHRY